MAADTFRLVLSFALVLFASGAVQRVHADQELTSPVYIDYNENLDVTNILELVSAGDRTLEATVTVYDPTGFVANRVEVSLEPGAQQDLIINDLVSSVIGDIYGVVKVDYNSGRAKIAGR